MQCINCGSMNNPGEKYCTSCGCSLVNNVSATNQQVVNNASNNSGFVDNFSYTNTSMSNSTNIDRKSSASSNWRNLPIEEKKKIKSKKMVIGIINLIILVGVIGWYLFKGMPVIIALVVGIVCLILSKLSKGCGKKAISLTGKVLSIILIILSVLMYIFNVLDSFGFI